MPTVFTKDGYRPSFYSNDHTPIHVHVRRGDGEAVFEVEGEVVCPRIRWTQDQGVVESRGLGKRTQGAYKPEMA